MWIDYYANKILKKEKKTIRNYWLELWKHSTEFFNYWYVRYRQIGSFQNKSTKYDQESTYKISERNMCNWNKFKNWQQYYCVDIWPPISANGRGHSPAPPILNSWTFELLNIQTLERKWESSNFAFRYRILSH